MSAAALRRLLMRRRRRLAAVVAVLALGSVVSLHHVAMADMGIGMGVAMVVCVAVLPAAATALAAVGGMLVAPRFVLLLPRAPRVAVASAPHPRARSSPLATVVLRR